MREEERKRDGERKGNKINQFLFLENWAKIEIAQGHDTTYKSKWNRNGIVYIVGGEEVAWKFQTYVFGA